MGPEYILAVYLVCSSVGVPDHRLCNEENATFVYKQRVANELMCGRQVQMTVGPTEISPSSDGEEYPKIVCEHHQVMASVDENTPTKDDTKE